MDMDTQHFFSFLQNIYHSKISPGTGISGRVRSRDSGTRVSGHQGRDTGSDTCPVVPGVTCIQVCAQMTGPLPGPRGSQGDPQGHGHQPQPPHHQCYTSHVSLVRSNWVWSKVITFNLTHHELQHCDVGVPNCSNNNSRPLKKKQVHTSKSYSHFCSNGMTFF